MVPRGAPFAHIGDAVVNGGWPPHVHFQVLTEAGAGGWSGDYPGVCGADAWPVYRALCPDPNLLLRCPWVPCEAGGAWVDGEGVPLTVVGVEVVVQA